MADLFEGIVLPNSGPCPLCDAPYELQRKWNGGNPMLIAFPTCTCEEDIREREVDEMMSRRFGALPI